MKRKPIHGQFYWHPQRPSVDKEKFLVWLCGSGLRGEMENLIIGTQYQALTMLYHQLNIMKQPADSS